MLLEEIKQGDVLQHKSTRGKFPLVVTSLGEGRSRKAKGTVRRVYLAGRHGVPPPRADFLPVELEPHELPSE